jgi:hypothetical protein
MQAFHLPKTIFRLSPRPPRSSARPVIVSARHVAVVLAVCLSYAAGNASAQLFASVDWQESPTPPPPAFDVDRLVTIGMPSYMTLKFGIDPATIVITGDGVVRYVVVARNPAGGAVNAFYEGVRCATEQMKGYARSSGGDWEITADPQWKSFRAMNSSYTKAIAQQALCQGGAPRQSAGDMIGRLKNPIRETE